MAGEERETVVTHPNRDKASAKGTKAIVILLLVVSAVLMAIVTIGGWDRLAGAKAVQIGYIVVYLVMAFYVARWNRGVLPIAAALAIILVIFAAISGPQWFERDKPGFDAPTLDESLLGIVTLLIVPVQLLLIAFAMSGFRQGWNIEVEQPVDRGRDHPPEGTPSAATA